jgi:hypothetical protein
MTVAGRVVVDKMTLIRAEAEALFQQHVNDQKEITNRMNSERMRAEMALSDALKSKKTKASTASEQFSGDYSSRDEEAAMSARTTPVKQSPSDSRHANNLASSLSQRNKQVAHAESKNVTVETKPNKGFSILHILINVIVVVIVVAPYAAGSLRMMLGSKTSVLPRIY